MTWMPFLCLAVGFLFGIQKLSLRQLKTIDSAINLALIVLMLTIGAKIGINDSVISNLPFIGIHCIILSLSAIFFSVLFTVAAEKTILPLNQLKSMIAIENINVNQEVPMKNEENEKTSPLIWIMPGSILTGTAVGFFLLPSSSKAVLDSLLMLSLIVLYTSVGISLGSNRRVFRYVRVLGYKVVYLSLAIFIGSSAGGYLAGLVLDLPPHISVMSTCGMSYYSLTGAYMTQSYGIEAGTYGFIVNVMREFFTVLLLPFLIKISKGSPIAAGAAGDMDTMLVPVTKFVGIELGLVALITGTILTFAVPFLLPFFYHILP